MTVTKFNPDTPVRDQLVALHSDAARATMEWAAHKGSGSVKGRYYWHGRAEVYRELLALIDSGKLSIEVLKPEVPALI